MKRWFLKRGFSLIHVTFNASSIKVVLFFDLVSQQRITQSAFSLFCAPLKVFKHKLQKSERKRENKDRKDCGACRCGRQQRENKRLKESCGLHLK